MKEDYVVYYTMKTFHDWFSSINTHIGDAPFQAVVQNFIYYPDPAHPERSRLESFVRGLLQFVDKARVADDSHIKLKSFEVKGVKVEQEAEQASVDDYVGDPGYSKPTS